MPPGGRWKSWRLHLSEHYHALGVRFVFIPDDDYLLAKDTIANKQSNTESDKAHEDPEPRYRNTRVAATTFYGKATIVVTVNFRAGGFSGADLIEYEAARTHNPIDPNDVGYDYANRARNRVPIDEAGLPAIAPFIGESGIGAGLDDTAHHAHEFGHYLSLQHTFQPDEFLDTPDDIRNGEPYYPLGSITCGNSRSVKTGTKTVTPDRNNNEGYWGCLLGRAHNSFSPLQLGKMNWVLQNQLNRYPLVACQPTRNYDADHLECENAESLSLCRETADYLKAKTSTAMECVLNGRFARVMAAFLQDAAVLHLLHNTPAGRALMSKLAGLRHATRRRRRLPSMRSSKR